MIFLRGLWHSAKVISAGLYWVLSLAFLWGGVVQLGRQPAAGQACIGFVVCLFLLRFVLVKRFISTGVFNVAATAAFLAFIVILDATGLSGLA
ncbi:MAG: hypothetical protein QM647_17695 [Asticcacaulis sp.]|uniref:hypothetical protein n=1 Tax=Asticcacaulis sp. TaxID=1872648 RepID=UPI0039E50890